MRIEQEDLFTSEHEDLVEPLVHADAHDTEEEWREAAKRHWTEGSLPRRVLELASCREGLTGWEAAVLTGHESVEWSVRPILSRLKKEGFVTVSRWRRRNGRGAREIVYVGADHYRACHEDPDLMAERDDV